MAPLPPLDAATLARVVGSRYVGPCATRGCAGAASTMFRGRPPAPGTERLCPKCRVRASRARMKPRRAPAPSARSAPFADQRAAAVAAEALVAHFGSEKRASLGAGLNKLAIHDVLRRGRAGTVVCAKLIEAAAKLPRAA